MNATSCIIAFALLITSCNPVSSINNKDKLFITDHKDVLSEVQQMLSDDQAIRTFFVWGTTDTTIIQKKIDSLYNKTVDVDWFEQTQSLLSNKEKDSISHEMAEMSLSHTKKLIRIINKYGYPSYQRIPDTSIKADPVILLEHADFSFKDTLLKLLQEELDNKRIQKNNYEIIKWHLNGRIGAPNLEGVKIIMKSKTGDSITLHQ